MKQAINKEKRPSKRQRKENPPSWLENENLAFVAAPSGQTIRTNVASTHDKELFLDRLEKEIQPMFLKSDKNHDNDEDNKDSRISNTVSALARKRIVMGTNQCTRILERLLQKRKLIATQPNNTEQLSGVPSLIVLARDIYPPTILSHIPVMAEQIIGEENVGVPVLMLPGPASQELGKIFGTKRVSVMLFLPAESSNTSSKDDNDVFQDVNNKITSFVAFVKKTLRLW